ncbi:unnamed protein product [Rhizophagus irregularis]|nr:unnamed protein product [Rhizophagus irregularis]
MKALFDLKADDYNRLSLFNGGIKNTSREIQNLVVKELLKLYKTFQYITSANEATHCEFISALFTALHTGRKVKNQVSISHQSVTNQSPISYLIGDRLVPDFSLFDLCASIFGGEVKVYPQYEIFESHGKRPIDLVIKVGNTIITITEAKKENINQGIVQNAVQLQTFIQRNPKRHNYDTAGLYEDVIYRIVSTTVDWVIIKLVSSSSENNSEEKVEVLLSSLSPLPLPINNSSVLTYEDLAKSVENLFGQIKWVFNRQLESELNTKLLAEIAELRKRSRARMLRFLGVEIGKLNAIIIELKKNWAVPLNLNLENAEFALCKIDFELIFIFILHFSHNLWS